LTLDGARADQHDQADISAYRSCTIITCDGMLADEVRTLLDEFTRTLGPVEVTSPSAICLDRACCQKGVSLLGRGDNTALRPARHCAVLIDPVTLA
jgi:hypothetical protein